MSIEVVLHPIGATREGLREVLEQFGFSPCEHLWDWPKGSLNFHWFGAEDYESFDGVEATIYPPAKAEQQNLGKCSWAIHTRTRASVSTADKIKQNDIIRALRKKFGGNFYNDWYGRNRYTQISPDPRDAAARGIYLSYELVSQNVSAVRFALPDPTPGLEKLVGTELEALSTVDPTRVLYNGLVPFAVAALEHFFAQTFKILLRYDPRARERLKRQNRKIELP